VFGVFVSYRHQDAEDVRPLVDALHARATMSNLAAC
jgi:hypothetical protein